MRPILCLERVLLKFVRVKLENKNVKDKLIYCLFFIWIHLSIQRVWVSQSNVEQITGFGLLHLYAQLFTICGGVRRAFEIKSSGWLKTVIGSFKVPNISVRRLGSSVHFNARQHTMTRGVVRLKLAKMKTNVAAGSLLRVYVRCITVTTCALCRSFVSSSIVFVGLWRYWSPL